jgi:hypothetical protein
MERGKAIVFGGTGFLGRRVVQCLLERSMDALPQIQSQTIPSGYRGTLKTIEHIRDLIKQGAKDFHVRQTAIDILLQRAVRPKDYLGEIKALFEWVQRNVRYTKDTFRIEVLHSAKRMLKLRAGDCDDMGGALVPSRLSIDISRHRPALGEKDRHAADHPP